MFCFSKEIKNTRIQSWTVLLVECAAPIVNTKAKDNVWTDMLSRLRSNSEATEPVEMQAVDERLQEHVVPFDNSLPVDELLNEQRKKSI